MGNWQCVCCNFVLCCGVFCVRGVFCGVGASCGGAKMEVCGGSGIKSVG